MPLVIADRVRETTTTSGTGTLTLAGPYSGFQAFSVIGNGNTTYYAIIDAQNGAWEVGIGAYTTSGNTLSRATVLASSNAGSLVNFGTGTKDVILTQPARRSVLVQEGGSGLITGVAAFTANGVPYADSTSTLATSANMTFNGTRLTVADLADSGLTSGRVTYASTGGALVDSANLTFDGTNLTLGGGTANGVAYLNGSKVLTTGSALVFDGANLGIGISSPNYLATLYKASLPILQLANSTSGSTASDGLLVYLNGANATISNEESGSLNFQTSGTLRATIDSSGNLGLGVTPSAWASGWKILQTPAGYFGCSNPGADGIVVGNNNYYDGSVYRYVASRRATQYQQTSSGEHFWRIAPSGTAGNAITFTQAMTLDASGNLLVGTTSPLTSASGRGNITVNGTDAVLAFGNSNSSAGYIYANSSNLEISAASTRFINFLTNGNERARIDSSGNFGIGTTSVNGRFQVVGVNGTGNSNAVFTRGVQSLDILTGYALTNGTTGGVDQPNTMTLRSSGSSAGNIAFATGNEERVRINTSGDLLVGTTSALGRVTVSGGKTALSSTDASFGQLQIGNTANGGEVSICFISGATAFGQTPTSVNGNQFIWAAGAGIYGIGGNSWGIGNLAAANFVARINWNSTSWIFSSDERLKDVEGRVENALDKVSVLRPVYFTWKNDEAKERKVGLLAQDVLQVLPEAVAVPEQETREDGTPNYLGLSMSDVVPLLTAAIQEQQALIQTLTARVAALESN